MSGSKGQQQDFPHACDSPRNLLAYEVIIRRIAAAAVQTLPFEHIGYMAGTIPADAFPRIMPAQIRSYVCAWSPYDIQFPLKGEDDVVAATLVPVDGSTKTLDLAYPNGFLPWMIRITLRIDDVNGRLPDGQTIQYVFNLPHK